MFHNDITQDRELIKGVELERDKFQNVKVAGLIRRIADLGYPVRGAVISYYSVTEDCYVLIGKDPIDDLATIQNDDIIENQRLMIKCRSAGNNISPQL
jgi:hypothetical protein